MTEGLRRDYGQSSAGEKSHGGVPNGEERNGGEG